jgi:hypothetical protein
MTKAELARELKISVRMVNKLAALGMPVDSVEAAKAWRKQNVGPLHAGRTTASYAQSRAENAALKTKLLAHELSEKEGRAWDEVIAAFEQPLRELADRIRRVPDDARIRHPDPAAAPALQTVEELIGLAFEALQRDLEGSVQRLREDESQ